MLVLICYLETKLKTALVRGRTDISSKRVSRWKVRRLRMLFRWTSSSSFIHFSSKAPPFYILNNSAKDKPLIIIFGLQNRAKFPTRLLETRPLHLNNVAALPCEEQLIW